MKKDNELMNTASEQRMKYLQVNLKQGLPFHSTIVLRELTRIVVLFDLVVDETATITHLRRMLIFFEFLSEILRLFRRVIHCIKKHNSNTA